MNAVVGHPIRVQLSRRKGWRMPPNTISVARPHRWGNPHRIGLCPVCGVEHTRAEAVAELRAEFDGNPMLHAQAQAQLGGKNLACWCKPGEECHADVLLSMANAPLERSERSDDTLRGGVGGFWRLRCNLTTQQP